MKTENNEKVKVFSFNELILGKEYKKQTGKDYKKADGSLTEGFKLWIIRGY